MGKGSRNRRQRELAPVKNPILPVKPTQAEYKAMMKAMDEEIHRQVLEHDTEYWDNITASTLFVLWQEFGFGETRLKRFLCRFIEVHDALRAYYEMDDTGWLCDYKLRSAGFNYKDWEKEIEEENKK